MNSLKYFFFAIALCAFGHTATAQDYGSAIGLRFGYPLSVSYKAFLNETNAVEAYVGFRGYGSASWFSINGAYQIHNDIESVDGLQWYYGGGAGVQFWSYDFAESSSTTFSLAGYLGLQYTFVDAPVSLTIDWVPTIFLGNSLYNSFNTFGGAYGALGARYTLGR